MERRISADILNAAHQISSRSEYPWYICRHTSSSDVVVPAQQLDRYMKMNYRVLCTYFAGKRYGGRHALNMLLRKAG